MYRGSLVYSFVGSLSSFLDSALILLPMSMGFVAWECQLHNKNLCGKYVYLQWRRQNHIQSRYISVMNKPMKPQVIAVVVYIQYYT